MVVFSCETVCAEVYRWTDENGHVHYSDKPKDDSAERIETVKDITPGVLTEAKKNARHRIQRQQRLVAIELENAANSIRKSEETQQKTQRLNKQCDDAKSAKQILELQAPVFEQKKNGERHYLTDDEREDKLTQLKSKIKKYCSAL